MMLGQSSDRIRVAKPWSTASYLTFALLLSSCGGGATDTATDNIPADSVESGPAASAAQLSYDANYSIDFAQSVAAGLEDAPQPQSANTPVIGAANSASDIPTTDTSQAVVIFEPESDSDANNGNGTDNNTDASNGNGSNTEASNGNNIDGNNNESANSNPSVDENANTGSDTVDVTEPSDTTGDIDSNTDVNTDSEIEFESIEAQGAEPTSGSTDQSTEPAGEPSPNNAEATDPEEEPTAGENTDVDYPGTDTGTDPAPEQNEVSEPDQGAATATDASNTDTDTQFFSKTTPGFNGEVLEDSIRVTWPVDPDARGYNVYRQAQFVTSVFTEEYIDERQFAGWLRTCLR